MIIIITNIQTCMYIIPHNYVHLFYSDTHECSDGTHNCSQICTNTNGSFTCGCNNGYLLDDDGATCIGIYILHAI